MTFSTAGALIYFLLNREEVENLETRHWIVNIKKKRSFLFVALFAYNFFFMVLPYFLPFLPTNGHFNLSSSFSFIPLVRWTFFLVGNEKLGGSRGWLLVEGDTGLWQSISVCFLM
jgi:hypothetical protein